MSLLYFGIHPGSNLPIIVKVLLPKYLKHKEMVGRFLKEAQIIVGEWVKHYNHVRPHSALGYRPPAPQTQVPKLLQNQPMLLQ